LGLTHPTFKKNKKTLKLYEPDVALCFDRYFTTTSLLYTLPYVAFGTCIRTRNHVLKFPEKLERRQSVFFVNK
jgi:hypothetical protein